jgi:hypothetical protein
MNAPVNSYLSLVSTSFHDVINISISLIEACCTNFEFNDFGV